MTEISKRKSPPYRGGLAHSKRLARLCSGRRPSQTYRSLVCNALDGASPDAERLGNLQDTHALRKLLSHLPFGHAVYLRPAELYALSDGALEAGFDALADHCALKLSERAGDLENELAHRRRRVDGLLIQIQNPRRMPRGAGSCPRVFRMPAPSGCRRVLAGGPGTPISTRRGNEL